MPYGIIDKYQLFKDSLSTKLHNVKAWRTVIMQYFYDKDSVSVNQANTEFVDTWRSSLVRTFNGPLWKVIRQRGQSTPKLTTTVTMRLNCIFCSYFDSKFSPFCRDFFLLLPTINKPKYKEKLVVPCHQFSFMQWNKVHQKIKETLGVDNTYTFLNVFICPHYHQLWYMEVVPWWLNCTLKNQYHCTLICSTPCNDYILILSIWLTHL